MRHPAGVNVEVHTDARWLDIPFDPSVDVAAWAAREAARAYATRDVEPPSDDLEMTTAVYAGLAREVRRAAEDPEQPLEAAFALIAADDPLPVTVATARRLGVPDDTTLDEIIGQLIAPEEDRYEDPEVDELDTQDGVVIRVLQHLLVPVEGGAEPSIQEWQAYLWHRPESHAAVLLSIQFVDLVDAAVFTEDVDHLVEGVRITA